MYGSIMMKEMWAFLYVRLCDMDPKVKKNESKTREARERRSLRSLRSYNHRCRPMGGLVPQMSPSTQTEMVLTTSVRFFDLIEECFRTRILDLF